MISEITAYYVNFLALLLVFLRLSIIFSISGIFDIFQIDNKIKFLFVFLLSTIVYTQINVEELNQFSSSAKIIEVIILDFISAFVVGFILKLILEMYKTYGEMLSYASGLSMATFYDPSGSVSHVYSPFIKYLLIFAIFSIDGHHIFIKGSIESFNFLPLGTTFDYFQPNNFFEILRGFGYIFGLLIFSTLPFMFIAVAIDIFFSYATKSMPAFNIFTIGIQLKILIIMILFYFSLPFIFELFVNTMDDLNWLLSF